MCSCAGLRCAAVQQVLMVAVAHVVSPIFYAGAVCWLHSYSLRAAAIMSADGLRPALRALQPLNELHLLASPVLQCGTAGLGIPSCWMVSCHHHWSSDMLAIC
jgi:hypothetical protein